jgi:FKBP-type peptidyl-prolyl cis-trans isomerase
MGRLFVAAAVLVVIPNLAWADGGDSRPASPAAGTPAAKAPALPPIQAELKSEKQKGSFAVGYNMGIAVRKNIGTDTLDAAAFLLGMQESLAGKPASLSAIEQEKAIKVLVGEIQKRQIKKATEVADRNRKKGEDFLAANKKQKGVTTLPSGVQYKVIREGKGKSPKSTDEVEVHYHGTLINGTVFDSSVDRGVPASFPVNRVIPGWTEVLQLMKEGSKWRVVIPSSMAYRQRGFPPKIGPNETLIFEIELLKVK